MSFNCVCGSCNNIMSIVESMDDQIIALCHNCSIEAKTTDCNVDNVYVAIKDNTTKHYDFGAVVNNATLYEIKNYPIKAELQKIRFCPNAPIIKRHYSRRHLVN